MTIGNLRYQHEPILVRSGRRGHPVKDSIVAFCAECPRKPGLDLCDTKFLEYWRNTSLQRCGDLDVPLHEVHASSRLQAEVAGQVHTRANRKP